MIATCKITTIPYMVVPNKSFDIIGISSNGNKTNFKLHRRYFWWSCRCKLEYSDHKYSDEYLLFFDGEGCMFFLKKDRSELTNFAILSKCNNVDDAIQIFNRRSEQYNIII